MSTDARRRMLRSAIHLFRQHGYSGTGFRDVIAHSGAPRGSIYHHFPGGKAELGVEVVRRVGGRIAANLDALAEQGHPLELLAALVGPWRDGVIESEFRGGCPILAVAVEDHPDAPQLRAAAAVAFDRWQGPLGESMRRAGADPERARRLAALVVASLEGAIVLCRVTRTIEPLDQVVEELEEAVRSAVSQ
ncbi:MAG TPA: TetR/AcrR family transcriptional regulator [Thermoleophilaceae bacterium]|nr:TetR/AcrR family transcriptional regulator [Thermoleophilaceae bacterium]